MTEDVISQDVISTEDEMVGGHQQLDGHESE